VAMTYKKEVNIQRRVARLLIKGSASKGPIQLAAIFICCG